MENVSKEVSDNIKKNILSRCEAVDEEAVRIFEIALLD